MHPDETEIDNATAGATISDAERRKYMRQETLRMASDLFPRHQHIKPEEVIDAAAKLQAFIDGEVQAA